MNRRQFLFVFVVFGLLLVILLYLGYLAYVDEGILSPPKMVELEESGSLSRQGYLLVSEKPGEDYDESTVVIGVVSTGKVEEITNIRSDWSNNFEKIVVFDGIMTNKAGKNVHIKVALRVDLRDGKGRAYQGVGSELARQLRMEGPDTVGDDVEDFRKIFERGSLWEVAADFKNPLPGKADVMLPPYKEMFETLGDNYFNDLRSFVQSDFLGKFESEIIFPISVRAYQDYTKLFNNNKNAQ
jgi:hypothetical protein